MTGHTLLVKKHKNFFVCGSCHKKNNFGMTMSNKSSLDWKLVKYCKECANNFLIKKLAQLNMEEDLPEVVRQNIRKQVIKKV